MGKIARYLNQLTIGNVFDTPEILEAYSTDRSVLKIKPRAVALPETTEDVQKLMRFCYQLATKNVKLPVTVRGSGLDETGADLGNGLILSTEKLNYLLEADRRERLVRVQAGITLKELNTALSVNGLTIPIGEHDNETIGGLISNCPLDPCAGKYGGIMRFVERIEVVLPNGDILQTGRLSKRALARKIENKGLEATIYKKLGDLVQKNADLIGEIRKNGHNHYGYPNIAGILYRGTMDLAPLFFGAQGTLGVITEVILRAVPLEKPAKRVVATFKEYHEAEKFLEEVKALSPRELEIYDVSIIKIAEETGKKLSEVTSKMKDGFVAFAQFDDWRSRGRLKKLEKMKAGLPKGSQLILEAPENTVTLDEFENSLYSFLNCAKSGERPPVVTDFYVPPRQMSSFVNDLVVLGNMLNLDLALYGSFATENYHLRPKFDASAPDFNKKATAFLKAGAFVIKRQGGAITGGSPEGRLKAIVTNAEMPKEELKLYSAINSLFDKYEIMNPAVKLGADNSFTLRHFRGEAGKITL